MGRGDRPDPRVTVTIGGLAPGGGTLFQFRVTARGASGVESATTANVTTITPDLPGGKTVTNAKVVQSAGTATYSADFVSPYSFHRVYIAPSDDVVVNCWWVRYEDTPNNRCAHWIIENSTLLVYTGTEVGQWSWSPVAYLPPTVNGYTYS